MESSVLFMPGRNSDWYRSLEMSKALSNSASPAGFER